MNKNIDFKMVGKLLYKLREKYRLNQIELAKELGVSKAAICQWESGGGIKTEKLYEIAKYFDITVAELISGNLNYEDDNEYFERNYNLNIHPDFTNINDKNVDDLLDYLQKCSNVIKRIFGQYERYVDNQLTKKQDEEFNRMMKFFNIDYDYPFDQMHGVVSNSLTDVIETLREDYQSLDSSTLDFELSKLYSLKIEVNPISVLEYSDETAQMYLSLLSKWHIDEMLTNYIADLSDEEIEKSIVVKRLIDNGANCLYTNRSTSNSNVISPDQLQMFEGIVNENKLLNEIVKCFEKKNEKFSMYDGIVNQYSWKMFSTHEYEILINKEKTNDIKSIIYLKNSKPEEYYEYIKSRDSQKLML